MKTEEIIAALDTMERDMDAYRLRLRTLRQDLFDTLDKDMDALVD